MPEPCPFLQAGTKRKVALGSHSWNMFYKGEDIVMVLSDQQRTFDNSCLTGHLVVSAASQRRLTPSFPQPSFFSSLLTFPAGFYFLLCLQITLSISKVVAEASFQLHSGCWGTGKGERKFFMVAGCFYPSLCHCDRFLLLLCGLGAVRQG